MRYIAASFVAFGSVVFIVVANAATWKVVKSKSANGQPPVTTTISATIKKPKAKTVAVNLIGAVSNGTAVIVCWKKFSVSSSSRTYTKAGMYVVPFARGSGSCQVTATIGGSGNVTVQILRLV